MTAPARVRRVAPDTLELTIHEGRKRQVKRMCEAVGHPVRSLQRVRFGPLTLGDLRPGAYRRLTPAELRAAHDAAGAAARRGAASSSSAIASISACVSRTGREATQAHDRELVRVANPQLAEASASGSDACIVEASQVARGPAPAQADPRRPIETMSSSVVLTGCGCGRARTSGLACRATAAAVSCSAGRGSRGCPGPPAAPRARAPRRASRDAGGCGRTRPRRRRTRRSRTARARSGRPMTRARDAARPPATHDGGGHPQRDHVARDQIVDAAPDEHQVDDEPGDRDAAGEQRPAAARSGPSAAPAAPARPAPAARRCARARSAPVRRSRRGTAG